MTSSNQDNKSVLTMWTLVITSAQFTRQNCNLRTLPHLLLKCVISTHKSRQAIQPHLSVSASTIREMTSPTTRFSHRSTSANIYKILQSAWSYRREVWCNPAGDEICHPGLNSPIVSLHYLLIYYLGRVFLSTILE